MALILAAKFSKLDTQAELMKSLIDAIGREQANTLMEQAVANAIVENHNLGLGKSERYGSKERPLRQEPSTKGSSRWKSVPLA